MDEVAIKRVAGRIHGILCRLNSPFLGERQSAHEALDRVCGQPGVDLRDLKVVPATDHVTVGEDITDLRHELRRANDIAASAQQECERLRRANKKLRRRLKAQRENTLSLEKETAFSDHSGLFDPGLLKLDPYELGCQVEELLTRRQTARHNRCAEIDLPLGRLGLALLHQHQMFFGKRKRRGSNDPSKTQWLAMYGGKDPSWVRKCIRAVIALNDAALDLRGANTVEEILRVQRLSRTRQR
jgi:hypothetical protein